MSKQDRSLLCLSSDLVFVCADALFADRLSSDVGQLWSIWMHTVCCGLLMMWLMYIKVSLVATETKKIEKQQKLTFLKPCGKWKWLTAASCMSLVVVYSCWFRPLNYTWTVGTTTFDLSVHFVRLKVKLLCAERDPELLVAWIINAVSF